MLESEDRTIEITDFSYEAVSGCIESVKKIEKNFEKGYTMTPVKSRSAFKQSILDF